MDTGVDRVVTEPKQMIKGLGVKKRVVVVWNRRLMGSRVF